TPSSRSWHPCIRWAALARRTTLPRPSNTCCWPTGPPAPCSMSTAAWAWAPPGCKPRPRPDTTITHNDEPTMTQITLDEATLKGKLLAPSITDDALEQARALLGMPIRIEQWNHEASWDAIRHYAWGLGDDNPLYCDPEYAQKTRYGTLIAPPTFFFGIWDAVVAPGLPDVQWFYAGIDAEFLKPIRRNDAIKASAEYVDVKPLKGKTVSNMLVQTGDVRYTNQDGELVTRV